MEKDRSLLYTLLNKYTDYVSDMGYSDFLKKYFEDDSWFRNNLESNVNKLYNDLTKTKITKDPENKGNIIGRPFFDPVSNTKEDFFKRTACDLPKAKEISFCKGTIATSVPPPVQSTPVNNDQKRNDDLKLFPICVQNIGNMGYLIDGVTPVIVGGKGYTGILFYKEGTYAQIISNGENAAGGKGYYRCENEQIIFSSTNNIPPPQTNKPEELQKPKYIETLLTGDDIKNGKLVKIGMRGDIVTKIQELLKRSSYNLSNPKIGDISNSGRPDSLFGNRTYNAVKEFQKVNNLQADGIVGPETWGKLSEASPISDIKQNLKLNPVTSNNPTTPVSSAENPLPLSESHIKKRIIKLNNYI